MDKLELERIKLEGIKRALRGHIQAHLKASKECCYGALNEYHKEFDIGVDKARTHLSKAEILMTELRRIDGNYEG